MNNLHTPIEDLDCHKKIKADITEYLSSVRYLINLTDNDRLYAKDLNRDEFGKIIVDITKPHILEDIDYFRESAIHFEKYGTYCLLHPNTNPNSQYFKFWKEESRRCREGYIRESDGEWITGYYYFYLNYSPILRSKQTKSGKTARLEGFPDFRDEDYLYFHMLDKAALKGLHISVLKVRGSGYSFKAASCLAKVFKLGDTQDSDKNQTAFAIADESEYLVKDGVLNKFEAITSFLDEYTPWPRSRLTSTMNKMVWKMGFKDVSGKVSKKSTLNSVVGVTLKNDSQRARGKRGCIIFWEEFGDFMDGLTSWQIARPSVEDGDFAFGIMANFGTGGVIGSGFRALEEMFYHPKAYNVLDFLNVWDKNTSDINRSAFFVPAYMNRMGCYDKNGNSDVTKALAQILIDWYNIKDNTSDHNIFLQAKAEIPIVPQDAMLRKEGSIFPTGDLKEYLSEILPKLDHFVASHYTGRLNVSSSGDIIWSPIDGRTPIREYPLGNRVDKVGAVEIFQQPVKTLSGKPPKLRYIGGCDPIDDDYSTTDSLPSVFIFDRFTDKIVAEYTGRPTTANEFYEVCLRLLKYYNALCNYECDKKGLYAYFNNKNSLHYLCETPKILKDMEMVRDNLAYGNKSFGTNSGKQVNAWARRLQADWLLSSAYGETDKIINEDGEEVEVEPKMNLQKIRSIGYLKELIAWNPDINCDRVSAMGMVMILRAELEKHEVRTTEAKIKTLANDPFFERTYGLNRVNNRYNR